MQDLAVVTPAAMLRRSACVVAILVACLTAFASQARADGTYSGYVTPAQAQAYARVMWAEAEAASPTCWVSKMYGRFKLDIHGVGVSGKIIGDLLNGAYGFSQCDFATKMSHSGDLLWRQASIGLATGYNVYEMYSTAKQVRTLGFDLCRIWVYVGGYSAPNTYTGGWTSSSPAVGPGSFC